MLGNIYKRVIIIPIQSTNRDILYTRHSIYLLRESFSSNLATF